MVRPKPDQPDRLLSICFMVLASRSILTMLMVLVSHMVPLANTSGPLPVDEQTQYISATCPCVTGSTNGNNIPSFVGQNYFCESGLTWRDGSSILFSNGDPLWDGQGCSPTSSCCTFNSPPWFNVTFPFPTTDYIEVRICDNTVSDETPIQLVELYVKWTWHINTANKMEFVASVVDCGIVAVFPLNLLLCNVFWPVFAMNLYVTRCTLVFPVNCNCSKR